MPKKKAEPKRKVKIGIEYLAYKDDRGEIIPFCSWVSHLKPTSDYMESVHTGSPGYFTTGQATYICKFLFQWSDINVYIYNDEFEKVSIATKLNF